MTATVAALFRQAFMAYLLRDRCVSVAGGSFVAATGYCRSLSAQGPRNADEPVVATRVIVTTVEPLCTAGIKT